MNNDNDELIQNDIDEEQDVLNSIAEDDLKLTPPMTGWIGNSEFLQMYCSPSYQTIREVLNFEKDETK